MLKKNAAFTNSFLLSIVRTDNEGNLLLKKVYAGSESLDFQDLDQKSDGCYILLGNSWRSNESAILFRIDGKGNTVWERTFVDELSNDYEYALNELRDSGFIIAGASYPRKESQLPFYCLIKTDANGNTVCK